MQEIEQIVQAVRDLRLPLVEVTGGEPLAQKHTAALLAALCKAGFEVLLETSGTYEFAHLDPRVKIIADLKCPGSTESARNLLPQLAKLRPQDELKIVVADRADFTWALAHLRGALAQIQATILWSAVAGELPLRDLAAWMLAENAPGRLQIQLHKVIWPEIDRGCSLLARLFPFLFRLFATFIRARLVWRASGDGSDIFRRIGVEFLFAARAAEIVGFGVVHGAFGVDVGRHFFA